MPSVEADLQQEYERLFDLFIHPGWKDFVELQSEIIEITEKIDGLEDAKQLHYNQGRLSILRSIVGFEDATKAAYDEILAEEDYAGNQ